MERSGESIRLTIILSAYQRGFRSDNLGSQPAPWVVSGLKKLESGVEFSDRDLEAIDRAGGTDHNDPWFT